MIHNIRISSIGSLILGFILLSCGGGSDEPTPVPVPAPGITTLSLPANNTACLQGTSATTTTASVIFSWGTASNAVSYQLVIKNLKTQISAAYTTTKTGDTISLAINTPYAWSVSAINSTGKTTSDSWKFYLSGTASSSYAPFAADLTSPASGAVINSNGAASVSVAFSWTGSDPDNDIASYALYLDNVNASTQVVASQTVTTSTQILARAKTYYWKVITTDKMGNTSISAINSFRIN
ncbi:hypothetical protein [Paludibacter jiangxiensis]|uniref:Fibronectin type-III domain-containing protein n=1 Tax=Paludibacter jiangxiensis TaxID=681398 RepID=A0A170ZUL8_9BACT|nr:hypothetical protein [Paludibacter jiangxiensis]GAT63021.1 hypothetical protein PJIAN_3333 [Paludibacter jiangxiensis]